MYVYLGDGDPRDQERRKLTKLGILETCSKCRGSGNIPDQVWGSRKCPKCSGTGQSLASGYH